MCNFRSTLVYHPPSNSASTLSLQTLVFFISQRLAPMRNYRQLRNSKGKSMKKANS